MQKKKKKKNYRDNLEIAVCPRTIQEHFYMLMIIVYYQALYKECGKRNMMKYILKHHRELYERVANRKNFRKFVAKEMNCTMPVKNMKVV